jgi:hypothetical protein
MTKTVVALYDDISMARHVVSDLVSAGIARENISLVANDVHGDYDRLDKNPMAKEHVGAVEGSVFGAAVGALTGMLVALGAAIIPGIGPVIVAGPLASALAGGLTGAVAGGATGGIVGGLLALDIPENEASLYAEGVRRGGTLVTATVNDDLVNSVEDVMRRHNPIDVDRRAEGWKQTGWNTFNPTDRSYTSDEITRDRELYRNYDAEDTQPTGRVRTYDRRDRSARV